MNHFHSHQFRRKPSCFDKSKYWIMVFKDKDHIETRQVDIYRDLGGITYLNGGVEVWRGSFRQEPVCWSTTQLMIDRWISLFEASYQFSLKNRFFTFFVVGYSLFPGFIVTSTIPSKLSRSNKHTNNILRMGRSKRRRSGALLNDAYRSIDESVHGRPMSVQLPCSALGHQDHLRWWCRRLFARQSA